MALTVICIWRKPFVICPVGGVTVASGWDVPSLSDTTMRVAVPVSGTGWPVGSVTMKTMGKVCPLVRLAGKPLENKMLVGSGGGVKFSGSPKSSTDCPGKKRAEKKACVDTPSEAATGRRRSLVSGVLVWNKGVGFVSRVWRSAAIWRKRAPV